MKQRAWWLGAAASVVALPVLGVGGAAVFVNPDDYKPQLAAALEQATGRALTLGGPLRISRSLWPTIEVSDVKLANLPGGSRADMARAERIEAQLSLPALLWRRIEVIKLTLIGPNILFEAVGGKPNWLFDAAANAAPGAPRTTLSLQAVHVQNGLVTFRLTARTKVIGVRSWDFSRPVLGGPIETDSVLVYADYAAFSLHAKAQPAAGAGAPWTTQLDFAAFDTAASASGTMNLAGDYDLQVEAKSPALEKLNLLLPAMQLPPLHDLTVSTRLTNGPVQGAIPVVGATKLHFRSADMTALVPGLTFGTVDVALPRAGGAAVISGAGSLSSQSFTIAGTVGVPEHLDGRATVPIDLKTTAAAAGTLAAKGKLTLDTGRFAGLDTAVSLRMPGLATLRPVISPSLPALTDVAFDGRVSVPGDGRAASIRAAKLATHEGEMAGDATIGLSGPVVLQAALQGVRIDLDALLTAFDAAGPNASGAGRTGFADTRLPWAALRGRDIDVKANIEAVKFREQSWNDLEMALLLREDRLRIALPGKPFGMILTAAAGLDDPAVDLSVHAPGIPLALLVQSADLPGKVTGGLRVDAQLRGAGRTVHEFAATLNGTLAATMTDGSLSNAALVKLADAALQALSIKVPAQGETAIHCFGLVGAFNKGVGRFNTIALATTYLDVSGAGQIDLGAETLALKLHPQAQLSGSSVTVPVVIEGPFSALQGRLDASGLDKLGLLIDAWFGGDRPQTCSDAGLMPPRTP